MSSLLLISSGHEWSPYAESMQNAAPNSHSETVLSSMHIYMALAPAQLGFSVELSIAPFITFSRSIADYPSMYAAIFSIIVLAVLFLNLLERTEKTLFKGHDRGYVSD